MKPVMLVPEKRSEDGYGQTCSLCDRPIVKRPLEPPPLRVEGGWRQALTCQSAKPTGRGGRPKWFVVQRELSWPILCSLLAKPVINKGGANVSAVVAGLNVLDAERAASPQEIEGNVHVSRLDDTTAPEPWAYAVTFAAFGDSGGAVPTRKVHGDDELKKLLLDDVGIVLPALVDSAIKRLRDEGHATITHVRLSPEQKRALAL